MQQKSSKSRLVLLILYLFPVTNVLSIYRFYAGRVLLGFIRIMLLMLYFINQKSNVAPYVIGVWAIITVFDFILILFGKFKDRNKLYISSFNPKKECEKYPEEKNLTDDETKKKAEEAEQKIEKLEEKHKESAEREKIERENQWKEEERIKKEKIEQRERKQKEKAERKKLEDKKLLEEKIASIPNLKKERNERLQKHEADFKQLATDKGIEIDDLDNDSWSKFLEEEKQIFAMFNSKFDYLEDNPFLK